MTGKRIPYLNTLYVILAAAILSLSSPAPCFAAEKLPVATWEWQPYTSAQMKGYGFFSEIVTAAFKEAGLTASYRFYPWKRCEAYVENGRIFAALPYSVTRQRKAFAHFSDPVSESTTVFFYNRYKHKTSIGFTRLQELNAYAIVGVLGYFYSELFDRAQLEVHYVTDEKKALKLIFLERYDLFPLNLYVGRSLIQRHYPETPQAFGTCKTPLSTDTLHLMVSKKFPDSRQLLDRFNAALKRIRQKGIDKAILSRHDLEGAALQ